LPAPGGGPFSHAYYGSIRHAITVGFASQMILGIAARVVPDLRGARTDALTKLWGPLLAPQRGVFPARHACRRRPTSAPPSSP